MSGCHSGIAQFDKFNGPATEGHVIATVGSERRALGWKNPSLRAFERGRN